MKPKLRFRDFAQGARENVEIVADVFNTSTVTKKTISKPNMKHLHFQAVRRQSLSVEFGPSFAFTQKRSELDRCNVDLRKTI
jgi:hypothetical protein